jgi:hypothetical protein
MTAWTSQLSIIVIFPLKLKYYTISLIICQSYLFDSLCLNTAQLRNTDDITARLKQIRIFVTISHDGGNARIVITMNRTYYWLFVT